MLDDVFFKKLTELLEIDSEIRKYLHERTKT